MRFVVACAVAALPCLLHASPLIAPSPGGPVFVGPTSASVSAIFWNPAASGLMQGHHIMVLGTAALDPVWIDRATISSSDGEPASGGDRSFGKQNPLYVTPGGIVGIVSDLGTTNFTLGVAGVLAFADRVPSLDQSLGYHSLGGSIYGQSTIFSLSYRATSRIYLGLGISLLFSKVDLDFLRDSSLDGCAAAPCNVESATAAERWSLQSDWDAVPGISFAPAVSASGGALVKLLGWWFGLSVVFPSGTTSEISKDTKVQVVPAGGGDPVTGTARVSYHVPWFLHFGMRRPVGEALELLINASWARLGLHQNIDIRLLGRAAREAGLPEWLVRNQGLDDVASIEIGLEQPPARRVRLGGRIRFQSRGVPSQSVAPDLLDAATMTLAGGVELRASKRLALILGYALGLQLPVDVTASVFSPRAAIDCNASGHDLDSAGCTASREGRAIPTAAGSYRRISNQLTVGLTYDIW